MCKTQGWALLPLHWRLFSAMVFLNKKEPCFLIAELCSLGWNVTLSFGTSDGEELPAMRIHEVSCFIPEKATSSFQGMCMCQYVLGGGGWWWGQMLHRLLSELCGNTLCDPCTEMFWFFSILALTKSWHKAPWGVGKFTLALLNTRMSTRLSQLVFRWGLNEIVLEQIHQGRMTTLDYW